MAQAEDDVSVIKRNVKSNKVVLGLEVTQKALRAGELATVYLSSNCPAAVKDDLKHAATLANVPLVELAYPNDELGVICKKPFFVSVLGIVK